MRKYKKYGFEGMADKKRDIVEVMTQCVKKYVK